MGSKAGLVPMLSLAGFVSQGLSHSFGEILEENPGRISHVILCHHGSYVKVLVIIVIA